MLNVYDTKSLLFPLCQDGESNSLNLLMDYSLCSKLDIVNCSGILKFFLGSGDKYSLVGDKVFLGSGFCICVLSQNHHLARL